MSTLQFSVEDWARSAASVIQDAIQDICAEQGVCRVMLTGGRSAERLYAAWRDVPSFQELRSVSFFFGDERCVPPDDPASNYALAMRTLFARGVPEGCSVFRIEAEDADREGLSFRYESLLSSKIDVLLLSVGEDGHIASLFSGNEALFERSRKVVPVTGSKEPRERITVTPVVIAQSSSIFVLATGEEKAAVFRRVLAAPHDYVALPACLVKDAIWLLDTALSMDI
ncbi:6-phosphogluconolactonase [Dechloromonas denitrificans]|uniref:6-phosphogluconolactonase n=1 Tax=Dechloromonas denitrificans TaxID=281362 RepID=UPI001CF8D183|nr:6-phosphogluconolactonase [Dechloromonas denitrificans]UCV10577.1 6-phosphogluconolactonase [Dechloromonas denitrificans]